METATNFFALLALLTNVAVAGWLIAVISGNRGRAIRDAVAEAVAPVSGVIALAVAATATAGSLYYSESVGLIPCELCWYQRIAMYPLVVLLAIGVLRRDAGVWRYVLPLAGLGLAIASYHYLIQRVPSLDATSCSAIAPCASAYFYRFGFISIPYMAASAFSAIAVLGWVRAVRP